jgi:outer membrane protein
MNKTATIGFILCSLVLNSAIARAEESKIGIIDMQKCIQNSEAGKKAKSELETAFNKKKKELQDQEAGLKKMQEEFQKKQAALSEAARREQQEKIQERIMKFQENFQRSQAEIQKKEQEMSAPIIQKIRDKVSEIAKKRGLNLILEKNDNIVLYSEDKFEITDEVMKSLN